jgi:hypothetical protein
MKGPPFAILKKSRHKTMRAEATMIAMRMKGEGGANAVLGRKKVERDVCRKGVRKGREREKTKVEALYTVGLLMRDRET